MNHIRIDGPTAIDWLARVVSANDVKSPLSGLMAAFVDVEVVERRPLVTQGGNEKHSYDSLGHIIFGDVVTLQIDDGDDSANNITVHVIARRAELSFVSDRQTPTPIDVAVPELVPLMNRARHGGVLCQREHLVLHGDRLRLRAIVERSVAAKGYRSAVAERLVVRDDLRPVLLDEVSCGLSASSAPSRP